MAIVAQVNRSTARKAVGRSGTGDRGVDTYLETVYYVRQEARQVALRFAGPIGLVSPTGRWAGRFERCHAAENGQRGSDQLSTGYRRGPGEPDQ
jgi:hypothetical protein